MEVKGRYSLIYTSDKETLGIILVVELKQVEGIPPRGSNIWEGIATLDGQPYTKENLKWCVNALIAAERIGLKLKEEIKTKCKAEGKSFRVKSENIK